jgi:transcriptional regulator PpsR
VNQPTASTHRLASLSALAPELASTVAALAGDIAMVVDADGVVRNVSTQEAGLSASADAWVGRPWAETVTTDTRRKIENLLDEVRQEGRSRRREVNHPSALGQDIPVAWAAVRLGDGGPVLAVGRDLRVVAAIQQRFLESQQELERDYWKRRQTEARYRLLFQVATDAVLVLDAQTYRVVEANQAATHLLGESPEAGGSLPQHPGIDPASQTALTQLLLNARSSGRAGEIRLRLAEGGPGIELSATPFRVDQGLLLLVRARAAGPTPAQVLLAEVVEHAVDAIIVTDTTGRLMAANPAFKALLCPTMADAGCGEGQGLHVLLPEASQQVDTLINDARRFGMAARVLLPRRGDLSLEATAVLLPEGEQERIGITFRVADLQGASPLSAASALVDAMTHLATQVGSQTLPQMMRQAAALAERHLIQVALQAQGPGLDAVAGTLGLSVDNLELRMRRLGMVPGHDGAPVGIE